MLILSSFVKKIGLFGPKITYFTNFFCFFQQFSISLHKN